MLECSIIVTATLGHRMLECSIIVTATLGHRVLECSIIDNLLFSDHVPLKIRLDLNVDHMFERN